MIRSSGVWEKGSPHPMVRRRRWVWYNRFLSSSKENCQYVVFFVFSPVSFLLCCDNPGKVKRLGDKTLPVRLTLRVPLTLLTSFLFPFVRQYSFLMLCLWHHLSKTVRQSQSLVVPRCLSLLLTPLDICYGVSHERLTRFTVSLRSSMPVGSKHCGTKKVTTVD